MPGSDHPTTDADAAQLSSIDVIASAMQSSLLEPSQLSSPDGAVTLLFTAIDQAPSVAQRLGPERWSTILSSHEKLVGGLVTRHDGQIVKAERDGFLASFPSAHAGLRCAVELQRAVAGGAFDGGESVVSVHTGLHSGFVIEHPGQLLGRNVVLAARIAAHAKGGEILVSSTLKQYTEADPSFRFDDRGEFHFKGVLGEHTVYAVRWDEDAG
ncbi:MAG: adenylate/guanylate cyclase domain-containing protein [Solirubrobacteraceae bacterium]